MDVTFSTLSVCLIRAPRACVDFGLHIDLSETGTVGSAAEASDAAVSILSDPIVRARISALLAWSSS